MTATLQEKRKEEAKIHAQKEGQFMGPQQQVEKKKGTYTEVLKTLGPDLSLIKTVYSSKQKGFHNSPILPL